MAWAEGEDWIVVKADRTVLYPQRMELQEEETLMEVLEMYPELLVEGYSDVVNSYQIRMDNVKMSGEPRLLLMQIRARDVKTVQIVDNPGVAKGTTGLGGVIDITLMPMLPKVQGMAEVQSDTHGSVAPTLNLRYASERTNLWLNTQYGYVAQDGAEKHTEHLDFHTTTHFSPHDRLLAYVKQDFGHADDGATLDISRNYLARARYFHTFNDKGTELLSLLGYQHAVHPLSSPGEHTSSLTQTPLVLLELNTPLFTPRLSMMLGTEGDIYIIIVCSKRAWRMPKPPIAYSIRTSTCNSPTTWGL